MANYYFPVQLEKEGSNCWGVAYQNHRLDVIPVVAGMTFERAREEAQKLTVVAIKNIMIATQGYCNASSV